MSIQLYNWYQNQPEQPLRKPSIPAKVIIVLTLGAYSTDNNEDETFKLKKKLEMLQGENFGLKFDQQMEKINNMFVKLELLITE